MSLGQEEVGKRIRQARKEANLTQPQLANLIGLEHPQSISNYERGVTETPTKRLRRIAEATKKDLSFFVGEVSAPEVPASDVAALAAEIGQLQAAIQEVKEALGIGEAAEAPPPPRRVVNGDD